MKKHLFGLCAVLMIFAMMLTGCIGKTGKEESNKEVAGSQESSEDDNNKEDSKADSQENGKEETSSKEELPSMMIQSFYYYVAGEMVPESYTVTLKDGTYYMRTYYDDEEDLGEPIETSAVDELYRIYIDNNVASWNGFDKTNEGVLDGETFSLEIVLVDGTSIRAHGDNAFPENYFEVMGQFRDILMGQEGDE